MTKKQIAKLKEFTAMTGKKSILGQKHLIYKEKSSMGSGIVDDINKQCLYFYPSGYTKKTSDGFNRQLIYTAIWNHAVSRKTENIEYPLGREGHIVKLVPQSDNPYDENAIAVQLYINKEHPKMLHGGYLHDKYDLGYVPRKINSDILKNIHLVNEAFIFKIRNQFHKKYCTAKVALFYGNGSADPGKKSTINRFRNILEE